jgi:hypothetical protein
MSRGPLWSIGGALVALLAAGPGRELALLPPAFSANPAADAAIHLLHQSASQLADTVARAGHDLASSRGEDAESPEACTCEPRPRARLAALLSWVDSHLLAFLAGALVWPASDVLRLIRLGWLRRLAHVEASLTRQVHPPARP